MATYSLKEFAYCQLREHLTPLQAWRIIKIALRASHLSEFAFEESCNIGAALHCVPAPFPNHDFNLN